MDREFPEDTVEADELNVLKQSRKVKSRGWVFTVNNYSQLDLVYMLDFSYLENLVYMIVGFEEGLEGTPHMQGFLYVKNKIRRRSLLDSFPRAHLEPSLVKKAEEMLWANFVYCQKESNYLEFGEYPQNGKASWRKIEAAYSNPKYNMALYTQYRKAYREVIAREVPDKSRKVILQVDDKQLMKEPNRSKVFYGKSLETYDSEPIVYMIATKICDFMLLEIKQWAQGFPPKIKRGYELYRFDPDKVVLMVSINEYKFFRWYFKGMIDNKKSYHTIECHDQKELELLGLDGDES